MLNNQQGEVVTGSAVKRVAWSVSATWDTLCRQPSKTVMRYWPMTATQRARIERRATVASGRSPPVTWCSRRFPTTMRLPPWRSGPRAGRCARCGHFQSTVGSAASPRRTARQTGSRLAPVLGNPDFARERKLFVLAAGPHAALEKVRPLLQRLGQHLFVIGEDPGLANLMKLGANTLTATTLQCMGEVLALLRKGGIGGRLAFDVLTNSLFDSRVHKSYGGKIVEGRFSPAGMAVPLATKDLRLALAEAEHTAVPMPAASLVHDRLVAMAARGWSDLDWSALGLQAEAEAGLGDGR